jgi:hypothetical protein
MLFDKTMPGKVKKAPGKVIVTTEKQELLDAMREKSDAEILALAKEMELPIENIDGKIKDREAAIRFLIKGGCPNCGKKVNKKVIVRKYFDEKSHSHKKKLALVVASEVNAEK